MCGVLFCVRITALFGEALGGTVRSQCVSWSCGVEDITWDPRETRWWGWGGGFLLLVQEDLTGREGWFWHRRAPFHVGMSSNILLVIKAIRTRRSCVPPR